MIALAGALLTATGAGAEVDGAERLVPSTAGTRQGGVGALAGVPARFRDQAEAYFRRLAEERGTTNGGGS